MAYKVFSNGSVLQASEINDNLMNQSVMVFSNAAARTAAITVPLEGMLTWLEDLNSYETWNGTAWVSPFGMTLLKKQTIGSAVTSVTVTNAFSASFPNYKIMISSGVSSVSGYIGLRLGATAANYYSGLASTLYSTGNLFAERTNNGANFGQAGWGGTNFISLDVNLINPFLTKETLINGGFAGTSVAGSMAGYQASATSFTDFTLIPASGTLTGGTIYVYGYGDL